MTDVPKFGRLGIFAAVAAALIAGCGSGNSGSAHASTTSKVSSFCALNAKLDSDASAAFAKVSTKSAFAAAMSTFLATHRDEIASVRSTAPTELRSDLDTLLAAERRVAAGADPASLQSDPSVTLATHRLDAFKQEHCS